MKVTLKLEMTPELKANIDKIKDLVNARTVEREVLLPIGQDLKDKILSAAPRGSLKQAARSDQGRRRFVSGFAKARMMNMFGSASSDDVRKASPFRDTAGTKSIVARMRAFVPRKGSQYAGLAEVLVRSGAPHSYLVDKGGKAERRPKDKKVMVFIDPRTGYLKFRKRVKRMKQIPYFDVTVDASRGEVFDKMASGLSALFTRVLGA